MSLLKLLQRLPLIFICFHLAVFADEQSAATNDSTAAQKPKKTVLVVGGAGFIGSQVNKLLSQCGYETIVFDNLNQGKKAAVINGQLIKGDLADSDCLDNLFASRTIDAVMHFAALIDVGESCTNPGAYYQNNVSNTINLLRAMAKHSVNVLIFSSTAAIFGLAEKIPVQENDPCHPVSPYGQSKLMVEQIIRDFSTAHKLKYCCLRYFNAAGGDPEGIIKNYKQKESNLIPVALRCLKEGSSLTVFGTDYPTDDGSCVRDYIHVCDLASAHILAMEKLFAGGESGSYNLGNGQGYSVLEVLSAIEKVTGRRVNASCGERRAGDLPRLIADSQKAKEELGWKPQFTLEMMIKDAWNALN